MLCSKCGYDLSLLTSASCPECGTSVEFSRLAHRLLSWPARFTLGLVLVLSYAITTGLLAFVNSAILGHFDPKWGPAEWLLTWPLFGLIFTPALLLATAILIVFGTTLRLSRTLLSILLCVLVAAFGLCLLRDPDWPEIGWYNLALGAIMVGISIAVRGLTTRSS